MGGIREAETLKILMRYKKSCPPDGCLPICCVGRSGSRESPAFTCSESAGKRGDASQCRLKSTEEGSWNDSISITRLIGNKFHMPALQLARASRGVSRGHPLPTWVSKRCRVPDLGAGKLLKEEPWHVPPWSKGQQTFITGT